MEHDLQTKVWPVRTRGKTNMALRARSGSACWLKPREYGVCVCVKVSEWLGTKLERKAGAR